MQPAARHARGRAAARRPLADRQRHRDGPLGAGQLAHTPSLHPEMFRHRAPHAWFPEPWPRPRCPAAYHSSAIVLAHDGSVLITGSNPNTDDHRAEPTSSPPSSALSSSTRPT